MSKKNGRGGREKERGMRERRRWREVIYRGKFKNKEKENVRTDCLGKEEAERGGGGGKRKVYTEEN